MKEQTPQPGRAPRGGTVGVNGEFYGGGTFLPSTQSPKRSPAKRGVATRKEEVAPYVWEVAPREGLRPIYSAIAGGFVNLETGVQNERAVTSYGRDPMVLHRLWERYRAGERWYDPEAGAR